MLYELLTLARPIASPTREGVLRQIVTKAMPPASWQNPAIPRDLEGVLHKAIAKDPDERYQTARRVRRRPAAAGSTSKPVAALPYRYRLDLREIKAERPAGITVLAVFHFIVAAFAMLMALQMGAMLLILSNNMLMKRLNPSVADALAGLSRGEFNSSLIYLFALWAVLSVYSLGVGFGLLAGKRWACWLSIAVFTIFAVWWVFMMVQDLYGGGPSVRTVFDLVILGLAGKIITYLLRRTTRSWFQLAIRVRAEHGQRHRRGERYGQNALTSWCLWVSLSVMVLPRCRAPSPGAGLYHRGERSRASGRRG